MMENDVSKKKVSKNDKEYFLLGGFFRPIPFKLFLNLYENCIAGGDGLALHRLSRRLDITYSHANLLVNRLFLFHNLFVAEKVGREVVFNPTKKGKKLYLALKEIKKLDGVKR